MYLKLLRTNSPNNITITRITKFNTGTSRYDNLSQRLSQRIIPLEEINLLP